MIDPARLPRDLETLRADVEDKIKAGYHALMDDWEREFLGCLARDLKDAEPPQFTGLSGMGFGIDDV